MMNKIIKFDTSYKFAFLEDSSIKIMHPVSNYFLKLNDLSINLFFSLKWLEWGVFFFTHLSIELKNLGADHRFPLLIQKSIQSSNELDVNEKEHVLLLDDHFIENKTSLDNLLSNFYNKLFDENTKVHLKLKLNLREYLIISNTQFPTLIKYN